MRKYLSMTKASKNIFFPLKLYTMAVFGKYVETMAGLHKDGGEAGRFWAMVVLVFKNLVLYYAVSGRRLSLLKFRGTNAVKLRHHIIFIQNASNFDLFRN